MPTTGAIIIVTVDHTGYTGNMDIGLTSMVITSGSSAHFSSTNIPIGHVTPPGGSLQDGWAASFTVNENEAYEVYAVSPDGTVGAAKLFSFTSSNDTCVLEIHIQPTP